MRVETLWAVRGKRSVMKCVLRDEGTWAELLLMQDGDVATREVFQDDDVARERAKALRDRLISGGWRDAS